MRCKTDKKADVKLGETFCTFVLRGPTAGIVEAKEMIKAFIENHSLTNSSGTESDDGDVDNGDDMCPVYGNRCIQFKHDNCVKNSDSEIDDIEFDVVPVKNGDVPVIASAEKNSTPTISIDVTAEQAQTAFIVMNQYVSPRFSAFDNMSPMADTPLSLVSTIDDPLAFAATIDDSLAFAATIDDSLAFVATADDSLASTESVVLVEQGIPPDGFKNCVKPSQSEASPSLLNML